MIRILRQLILFFLLATIILWVMFLGLLQTSTGKEWAVDQFFTFVEEKTGLMVEIKGLQITFPLQVSFNKLSLFKDREPVLDIHEGFITCAYWELLKGSVVLSRLEAKEVNFIHLPAEGLLKNTGKSNGFSFPFFFSVHSFNLKKIKIDSHLLNQFSFFQPYERLLKDGSASIKGHLTQSPFGGHLAANAKLCIYLKSDSNSSVNIDANLNEDELSMTLNSSSLASFYPSPLIDTSLLINVKGSLASWNHIRQGHQHDSDFLSGHCDFIFQSLQKKTPLLEGTTVSMMDFNFDLHEGLKLSNGSAKNRHLNILFHGALSSDLSLVNAEFEGTLLDVNESIPVPWLEIEPPIEISGTLSGLLKTPEITLVTSLPKAHLGTRNIEHLVIRTSANIQKSNISGQFNLTCDHQACHHHLRTSYSLENETLNLSSLHLSSEHSDLTGHLKLLLGKNLLDGVLELSSNQIPELPGLESLPLQGSGKILLTLESDLSHPEKGLQKARAVIAAQDIHYEDISFTHGNVSATMNPFDPLTDDYSVSLSASLDDVNFQQFAIESLRLTGDHHLNFSNREWFIEDLSTQLKNIHCQKGHIREAEVNIKNSFFPYVNEGNVVIKAKEISSGSLAIDELIFTSIRAHEDLKAAFVVQLQGKWNHTPLYSTFKGDWDQKDKQIDISLSNVEGDLGPYPIKMLQPLTLKLSSNETAVKDFHFQIAEGEFEGSLFQHNDFVKLDFNTNPLPSELFHFIDPSLFIIGRTSYHLHLEGPTENLVGQCKIQLYQLQMMEEIFSNKPFIDGHIDLTYVDSQAQVSSELFGIGTNPVIIKGSIPIDVQLYPFSLHLNPEKPFLLHIDAEGELDPYLHLFYNDTINITGQAKVAMDIKGSIQQPQITGEMNFFNGSYESLSTGAIYRDIKASFKGEDSKLHLISFYAHDDREGNITADGFIELDREKGYPFEFNILPTKIDVIDSDYIKIAASGQLKLRGNQREQFLEGALTIKQASIQLEEALPNQIKTIDVTYIEQSTSKEEPLNASTAEQKPQLNYDLKLEIPSTLTIDGHHITTEWKGGITMTGNQKQMLLNGDLRISKGEYNFNGKIFNLIQGNIHFAGSPGKKTTVYVVAQKEINDIKADIIIKGNVANPAISFRSNPHMSQREVLSYILFNRGIADITSNEGDQLTQSFISLNTGTQANSDDFLTRLRNNIGLDRLDFTSTDGENRDLALQLGKYITDSIFVSFNKSISDIGDSVAIEAKLRKNLKAQAEVEVGETTQGKVSLKWKKDY